jgi:lambda family phage portal protein
MKARENVLDKMIAYVAPKWGARRAGARRAHENLSLLTTRAYEGASVGRRTENWFAPPTSVNTEGRNALRVLRDRSRDVVRNNGYARRGVRSLRNNMIGAGILPEIKCDSDNATSKANALWEKWAEKLICSADGRSTLYGLQSLGTHGVIEGGEMLLRRRRRPANFGLPVPLQLDLLEADFIDTLKEGPLPNDGFILQGVEFDKFGRRVAYWLFDRHPGDYGLLRGTNYLSRRTPASEILPMYEMLRAGQVRGIPWTAAALLNLREFDEFRDATLLRQKIAAFFTAFIEDIDGSVEPTGDDPAECPERLEPGAVERLPPGKRISFPQTPSTVGFREFSEVELHAIAAALDVPYEALTYDYSNVNYSSARIARIEFQKSLDPWIWHMVIPQWCDPVFEWFKDAALVAGYDFMRTARAKWTPPKREMIDLAGETTSALNRRRGGLVSLSELIREQGDDPDKIFAEIERENTLFDEKKFVLTSDARRTTAAGMVQQDDPFMPPEPALPARRALKEGNA